MITTTIPTNLDFPNRGVLERDDFVNAQETAQDLLAGTYTTALNQYATELNDTEADINLKWEQVQSQAVTGGYTQAYINATFTPKVLNTQTDKTTPVDADLIPLSDSASSFGLKKLSWANIKATLISSFGVLINGLTAKTTPENADMIVVADSASSNASKKLTLTNLKTFLFGSPTLTGTPTAPTATAGTNTTQIATTAYVDGKMVLSTAVTASGTAIDFTNIPSWVKKITVMFKGVSTNGSSNPIVRVGSDTIETSGYLGSVCLFTTSSITSNSYPSSCFQLYASGGASSVILNGRFELINIDSNSWVQTHVMARTDTSSTIQGSGTITLSGKLNKIRVTALNGTDTFDAGQINIIYEG